MSHTPGPWKVDKEGFIWGRCPGGCRMEVSDFPVAEIRGTGHLQYRPDGEDMQAANARLIAAAPELYEALEELFDMMISNKVNNGEGVRRLLMATDVLAKARGDEGEENA